VNIDVRCHLTPGIQAQASAIVHLKAPPSGFLAGLRLEFSRGLIPAPRAECCERDERQEEKWEKGFFNVFVRLRHVLQQINVRIDLCCIRITSDSATKPTHVDSITCYGMQNSAVNCTIPRANDDGPSNKRHAMCMCNHNVPP
jgi:hypothetical protein